MSEGPQRWRLNWMTNTLPFLIWQCLPSTCPDVRWSRPMADPIIKVRGRAYVPRPVVTEIAHPYRSIVFTESRVRFASVVDRNNRCVALLLPLDPSGFHRYIPRYCPRSNCTTQITLRNTDQTNFRALPQLSFRLLR